MASKVTIANKALSMLGQSPIVSFEDNSTRAKDISEIYDECLKEVLAEHPFNFAVKRSSLAELDVDIPWTDDGLNVAYAYPSDCLRVLNINDNNVRWRVENIDDQICILSDASAPLGIRYIFYNENPAQYSPKFIEALAARLAAELSFKILQSNTGSQERWALYTDVFLPSAISANSQEGSPLQAKQDLFVLSKYGRSPSSRQIGGYSV
jgi:hypothetical protein